jgi:hypothetical protein
VHPGQVLTRVFCIVSEVALGPQGCTCLSEDHSSRGRVNNLWPRGVIVFRDGDNIIGHPKVFQNSYHTA